MAQMVKCLPTMWDTQVQSLGWEDPLEKDMATHSSILAWKIPWMEEPGWLLSMGSQRVGHDWATSLFTIAPYSNHSLSMGPWEGSNVLGCLRYLPRFHILEPREYSFQQFLIALATNTNPDILLRTQTLTQKFSVDSEPHWGCMGMKLGS